MLSTILLAAVSIVAGQAGTAAPSDDGLNAMAWSIGEFEGCFPSAEDIPGVCKKGDMIRLRAHNRWILKKHAIASRITNETADKGVPLFTYQGLIGWDPEHQRIELVGYDSHGTHSNSVWAKQGNTWLVEGKRVSSTGEITKTRMEISDISDHSFSFQTFHMESGNAVPDGPKAIVTRVGTADGNRDKRDD